MNISLRRFEKHLTLNNGVLALAVFLTAAWLLGTVSAIQRNFVLQQRAEDLKQQITLATLQNQNLAYQQKYYQSPEYLELSARQHFDKASPGESEILLPAHTVSSTNTKTASSSQPLQTKSDFEQWLYFLFGKPSSSS